MDSRPPSKLNFFVRQKWVEVPYREQTWAIYRKYLRRRFKLKQWRWIFEEQIGAREWCKKLENPFIVTAEKKYQIVLSGKSIRPHPANGSGAPPKMTKEQSRRPNSKGKLPSRAKDS
jgi:hypothetical protein